MKRKIEYLALVVVVAALGTYLAFHRTDQTHYELPRPAALDEKEITRILVDKPDTDLELKKTGDGWVISPQDYPAEKDAVQPMLAALTGLNLTALVSEGESYHPYDLDAENRLLVTAWAGDAEVRSFYIGKPATSYRHTFVKLPDDPRVYHAATNLRNTFEKDTDALRDMTVLSFDTSDIRQITVEKGGIKRELAFTQPTAAVNAEDVQTDENALDNNDIPEAPAWRAADGNAVGQVAVGKLLSAVSGLKCNAFIEEKTKDDLTDPVFTLTLAGSQTHTLAIYDKPAEDAAAYPATASDSDYPFELTTHKAEEIMNYLLPESQSEETD